jgi:CHAD domain-containing protein
MFRRVLKEGRAIGDDSPHEALHELRKSCKKLRYLIEFFQSLYPEKELKPLLKALRRLLDNLGEFQDLEVQAHKLEGFAATMQQEGKVPLGTLLAIGALVADLLHRQARARAAFHDRFAAFDARDNRAEYRRLFKPASAETAA